MPHFDDAPKFVSSPPIQSSGDAVVSNLQFNSPLQMYSTDNVIESLKGQTGAEIKDVIGLVFVFLGNAQQNNAFLF